MVLSTATTEIIEPVKILSAGRWETPDTKRWGHVNNPSTGQVIAKVPLCTAEDVDPVVTGGRGGLARVGRNAGGRTRARSCFGSAISPASMPRAGALVTREHGKTWENPVPP